MAFVAEQVGQQPIDFKTGAGEVMKGASEAAGLYAAQQKAEATKLDLENAKMKQDSMKSGITLDYLNKIANSPNPAVQKILKKQYAAQYETMYGKPMDQDTLEAFTKSPNFAASMQKLIDSGALRGNGKNFVEGINTLASALGVPYVDAIKIAETGLEMTSKEDIAAIKRAGSGVAQQSYNLRESKSVQAALKEAEEDKQVQDFGIQLVGANKGLELIDKALNNYQKTGNTLTYGQLGEVQTDVAALQAVKPSAVIPIAREKKLDIDVSAIDRGLNELLTNITVNPQAQVPLSNIRLLKSQLNTVKGLLQESYDRELDRGYSRGVASKLLTKEMTEQRKKDLKSQFNLKQTMGSDPSSSAPKTKKLSDLIKEGKTFDQIKAMTNGKVTKQQYDSVAKSVGK